MNRRLFIALLVVMLGAVAPTAAAWADDDNEHGGSEDRSGSESRDRSSDGHESSSDDHDDGNDDGGSSSSGGGWSGGGKSTRGEHGDRDHDRARTKVLQRKIKPLKDVIQELTGGSPAGSAGGGNGGGGGLGNGQSLIGVELKSTGKVDTYVLKMLGDDGTIRTVSINAQTGKIVNALGF